MSEKLSESPTASACDLAIEDPRSSQILAAGTYNVAVDAGGVDEAKLIRKLDITLIPWLSLLYLLSFLDRASIGNARVSSCLYFLVFLTFHQHICAVVRP